MGGGDRRAGKTGDIFQGQRGHLRHIDDHAQIVQALDRLLTQRRQPAKGIGGVVEERQRSRGVGPVVVAGVAEAEHAHATRRPQVELGQVVAERVGIEHADEDGELAFAVQASEVFGV